MHWKTAAGGPGLEPPSPASAGRNCAGVFCVWPAWRISGVRARARFFIFPNPPLQPRRRPPPPPRPHQPTSLGAGRHTPPTHTLHSLTASACPHLTNLPRCLFHKRSRAIPACAGWGRWVQHWATSCFTFLFIVELAI